MKQSRSTSLMKSLISTAVGLGLSIFLQWLILPMLLGVPVPLVANLSFAAIMTAVSIGRGYLLERFFEWMGWRVKLSPFATAVLVERQRQKDVEGWDEAHDDAHEKGELAAAGGVYALGMRQGWISDPRKAAAFLYFTAAVFWPWDRVWLKITSDERRNWVKSAALIIAEGERFDRARKSSRKQVHA